MVPQFAREVEGAVNALSTRPPGYVDENEFIDASRLVYDGVREIRRAVLMNRVWGYIGNREWGYIVNRVWEYIGNRAFVY